MKRFFAFLLCFLTAFVFSSCKTQSTYDAANQEKVTMTVKEGTLTKESVTLIIENKTAEEGNYGYSFLLEKQENGQWYLTNGKQGFILLIEFLEPNSVTEHKAVFEKPLEKGKYRLIKTFSLESGPVETHVEFEIK